MHAPRNCGEDFGVGCSGDCRLVFGILSRPNLSRALSTSLRGTDTMGRNRQAGHEVPTSRTSFAETLGELIPRCKRPVHDTKLYAQFSMTRSWLTCGGFA